MYEVVLAILALLVAGALVALVYQEGQIRAQESHHAHLQELIQRLESRRSKATRPGARAPDGTPLDTTSPERDRD